MSPRHLISFSGRLLRLAFFLVIGGVVLFFALTRTEVGREGLRVELERQFSRSFDGRLEIDKLTGNLLNRLSAGGVVVRDSSGRTLLSIDSVIINPSWSDLFRRTISTGRITLLSPEVHLHRNEQGQWNFQQILRPTQRTGERVPWSFHATHIRIEDGRIVTSGEGDPPPWVSEGVLFDYANTELRDLDGRLIVDWGSDLKLVDVLELHGRIPNLALDVDTLRGQFVVDGERISVTEAHLSLGSSDLHVTGYVSSFSDLWMVPDSAQIELDVHPSTLNASELSRLLPKFPLRDEVTASLRIQGPFSGLVLEELTVERGSSNLAAEGTLLGLPDRLDFEIALRHAFVHWRDFHAVWPASNVSPFDHLGRVSLTGYADGILHWPDDTSPLMLRAETDLQIDSRAGRIAGDGTIAIDGESAFRGVIHAADLDIGRLLNRPRLSSALNGRLDLDVVDDAKARASGRAALELGPSIFAGRIIDTLSIHANGTADDFAGELTAVQGSGALYANLTADSAAGELHYRLDGATSNFNLGNLILHDSLTSSLNTRFSLAGSGKSWKSFEGDASLSFQPSQISLGEVTRSIPSHESTLEVHQLGSSSPRLILGGDVVRMDVTGDVTGAPFVALMRHWGDALASAASHAYSKRFRPSKIPEPLQIDAAPGHRREAALALTAAGLESQHVSAHVQILRSDIISALLPMLPPLRTDAEATADLHMDEDQFSLTLDLAADSLHIGTIHARGVELGLSAGAPTADSLAEAFEGSLRLRTSQVAVGEQHFTSPDLAAAYYDSGIDIDLDGGGSEASNPFRFAARLDLLGDRNQLTVHDLQLAARDELWKAPASSVVDLYEDAVIVHGMRIARSSAGAASSGQVFIEGSLSSAPQDTLFLNAENILLQHVTEMLAIKDSLSGTINGRLAFTGLSRRPELTGRMEIEPLAYRNRLLGSLTISSRYIPGSPDVGLSVHLRPTTAPTPVGLVVEESTLAFEGTFRLPGGETHSGQPDPGSLDLDVVVQRADAFFFEYIFTDTIDDVGGYLSGGGHIGGSFVSPLFEAELQLHDGGFYVPEFRLAYMASGPVRVDAAGIHLDGIDVADPTGGTAFVQGSILFNEYRYFSFDLRGDFDELRIMNVDNSRDLPFYGRIWTSGDMILTGPLANASLESSNVETSPSSELYIPISETGGDTDAGFIVFADSSGRLPDLRRLTRRRSVLADRPAGERPFLDGLEINLDISAPEGSTVHLVIDPLLGDVINAVGSGQIQLARNGGEFTTFGTFDVSSGDYLFTAGEVFFRRFLIDSGTIAWDGDPLNAMLDITASYRTRASTEGLGLEAARGLIPLVIRMNVIGRVASPTVDLSLAIDRDDRRMIGGYEGIEAVLNQPEHAAQYATSVLLTNSFLLTTSAQSQLSNTRNQLAFNSLSQLVASQLNRYLNYALPNVDLNFGVQGESTQDLDVTYGVALRLLDERLIIRGQGIYQSDDLRRAQQGVLDEFVVEVRMNPRVSVEVFYRNEGDILSTDNTSTTGAGLSYQTEFPTWRKLMERLFGWMIPEPEEETQDEEPDDTVVAGRPASVEDGP